MIELIICLILLGYGFAIIYSKNPRLIFWYTNFKSSEYEDFDINKLIREFSLSIFTLAALEFLLFVLLAFFDNNNVLRIVGDSLVAICFIAIIVFLKLSKRYFKEQK